MSRRKLIFFILAAVGVVVLAFALRLFGINLYDLQIDEITYAHFALTIDAGQLPRNYGGGAFFLHPPGYFWLLAVWRELFWHGTNMFAQFTMLRGLNVFLSVFTDVAIIVLIRFVTKSNLAAIIGGLLYALDPFAIRQNTRSLMETATTLWLLTGFSLMLPRMDKKFKRGSWLLIGLLFGIAAVSKDVAGLLVVTALAIMTVRRVGPSKEQLKYLIPTMLAPYLLWIAVVTGDGYLSQFVTAKTAGIQRFLGLLQTTGFNKSGAPSKGGTLLQTVPHYASSYAIMGLGVIAGCYLLFASRNLFRRRWGAIGVASALIVAYLYVAGTFEEQFLYYLLIPSLISVVAAACELWKRTQSHGRIWLGVGLAVMLMATISYDVAIYATDMSSPDKGWTATTEWILANVPKESTVCTPSQGEFILSGQGYDICTWSTSSDLEAHHVNYVIISEKLSAGNYEPLSLGELTRLRSISTRVFRYSSRDSGVFDVYELSGSNSPAQPAKTEGAQTNSKQPDQIIDINSVDPLTSGHEGSPSVKASYPNAEANC